MKRALQSALVATTFLVFAANAQEKINSAEELVRSMTKADMTYRQLMQMMGESLSLITQGILSENKQMVERGTDFLLTHPAPRHKPWSIMPKEAQSEFKAALVTYDKVLENYSMQINAAVKKDKWLLANQNLHDLNSSCLSEGVQNSVSGVALTERYVFPVFRQNVWPVVTASGSSFVQGVSSARRPSVYPRRAA